jgi:hypothetical protein
MFLVTLGFQFKTSPVLAGNLSLKPCPQPFSNNYFSNRFPWFFCLGLALNQDLPTYASCIPEITDVHHHAQFID